MRSSRFLGLALILTLVGCAGTPDEEEFDPTASWDAPQFYDAARNALNLGNYSGAIDYYENLESRYPFGPLAKRAQIEAAYAYYKYDEPDSAIASADRFIRMNPRHELVDYAYYLKGLVNFHRGLSLIDRWFEQDPSERDPGAARNAFNDFNELLSRFPDSRYAHDARARMLYLRNNLAMSEIHAADYYLRRGAYVAAINRAQQVLANFEHTPAVRHALATLVRAYSALGFVDLSRDSLRVFELNFGDDPVLEELQALVRQASERPS